ncbi:cellular nucleic acid-binding protein, partial [Trifolium medium]|nr:cellular nucleic acid-binding protein [Trifolium medium]
ALNNVAQAFVNNQGNAQEDRLDRFLRNNSPTFKGLYDPESAQDWLQEIERIFRAMASTNAQRAMLEAHMLKGEADRWWSNMRQRITTRKRKSSGS